MHHYLDIETTGFDPRKERLLTLQYRTLKPRGPLIILKAYAHPDGERGVLRDFEEKTRFFTRKWDFLPVGWNADFEKGWLWHKAKAHGIMDPFKDYTEWSKPWVDLQQFAILALRGELAGSKLEHFSTKVRMRDSIPAIAAAKDWRSLESYIRQEADGFADLWDELVELVPSLWEKVVAPRLGVKPWRPGDDDMRHP